MKKILFLITSSLLLSCSGFLDTAPKDALSPATFWKTEKDANDAAIGCYSGWYGYIGQGWDNTSDHGFSNFPWEGYQVIGNGRMVATDTGNGMWDFSQIRRCNTFLANVEAIEFKNPADKADLIAQVRAIRATNYFMMNFWYGGVPIIGEYATAEEAQVPRNSIAEVNAYVNKEFDELIPSLYVEPKQTGRICRGVALAVKMRSALYNGEYQRALDAANEIKALNKYSLEPEYNTLFLLAGKSSKEIIYAEQRVLTTAESMLPIFLANNSAGGWSSHVPTQTLVDAYEMSDGLTKEESRTYDPVHPFAGRDPRMEATVIFPGQEFAGAIVNSMDKEIGGTKNPDFPTSADNSSKTALSWAKYLAPLSQYPDMYNTDIQVIVYRYAEVLLTIAEAKIELGTIDEDVYNSIDAVRLRAGMPAVDRAKYSNQAKLRELVRRERGVEFAGEGLRRADILRWKDASGKLVAETALNTTLTRVVGTVNHNEPDKYKRATVTGTEPIDNRTFTERNRYLPISSGEISKNPKLTNGGY